MNSLEEALRIVTASRRSLEWAGKAAGVAARGQAAPQFLLRQDLHKKVGFSLISLP